MDAKVFIGLLDQVNLKISGKEFPVPPLACLERNTSQILPDLYTDPRWNNTTQGWAEYFLKSFYWKLKLVWKTRACLDSKLKITAKLLLL